MKLNFMKRFKIFYIIIWFVSILYFFGANDISTNEFILSSYETKMNEELNLKSKLILNSINNHVYDSRNLSNYRNICNESIYKEIKEMFFKILFLNNSKIESFNQTTNYIKNYEGSLSKISANYNQKYFTNINITTKYEKILFEILYEFYNNLHLRKKESNKLINDIEFDFNDFNEFFESLRKIKCKNNQIAFYENLSNYSNYNKESFFNVYDSGKQSLNKLISL